MGITKRWLAWSLVGVLVLAVAGCVFSERAASQANPGVSPQRVQVKASQWAFNPSEVRVKANLPVEIVVTSVDVDHGIVFSDLDVPVERVPAGRSVTARFIPDKPGVYHFHCSVVCGTGHDKMSGVLVVE
ncbi:MAG: cupredoxin domain-containing protein [Dehalococcoidia bacterium]|nr:cupredoxin domain-containing protein [Dehalococcoidia bacterium]